MTSRVPYIADLPTAQFDFSKPNVLAERVHNSRANVGLWRPVLLQAIEFK